MRVVLHRLALDRCARRAKPPTHSTVQYSTYTQSSCRHRYEGEFEDNRMHGKGTFTANDGTLYVGPYTKVCHHTVALRPRPHGHTRTPMQMSAPFDCIRHVVVIDPGLTCDKPSLLRVNDLARGFSSGRMGPSMSATSSRICRMGRESSRRQTNRRTMATGGQG